MEIISDKCQSSINDVNQILEVLKTLKRNEDVQLTISSSRLWAIMYGYIRSKDLEALGRLKTVPRLQELIDLWSTVESLMEKGGTVFDYAPEKDYGGS